MHDLVPEPNWNADTEDWLAYAAALDIDVGDERRAAVVRRIVVATEVHQANTAALAEAGDEVWVVEELDPAAIIAEAAEAEIHDLTDLGPMSEDELDELTQPDDAA